MPILLATAVRFLGVTGCVALGIVIFYEGLPLGPLRYIPFLGPTLEQLVDGRVDRAFREGALGERLVWQERQRRELLRREAEERSKQQELDAIAARYREAQAARISLTLQVIGLEDQLKKEEEDAPGTTTRPFMPRGVSKRIDAIGR